MRVKSEKLVIFVFVFGELELEKEVESVGG